MTGSREASENLKVLNDMVEFAFSPNAALIIALILIGLALAASPLMDQRHRRRGGAPAARHIMYRDSIILLWSLAIIGVAGWVLSDRPLADIGFAPVRADWRGLVAWAITALIVGYCLWQIGQTWLSQTARASIRKQVGDIELTDIRPRTAKEGWHFQALSVTAGITEEIVFRGVLMGAFALVIPLWAAVILALVAFTLPHAYQGRAGMVRVAPTGAVLTAIVLLGGSLWPAILAHALIDMTAGVTFALLDRFEARDAEAELVEAPAEAVRAAGR
jgi:membrane protease YdiL (CAAX protease family)